VAKQAATEWDGAGVDIEALGRTGEPASTLVDEAEKGGFDLLVTGNKGMTGIRRLSPMGRVPAKVAHHLPCSLLVVKTT
jgi:nucleotide-binding universal stress UspA family protein